MGGFFGNPEPELLVRWYQAGAFYPFFRAHAHIDTKRREPWLFGEPYTSLLRDALRLRYQLLPSIYTTFHRTSITGSPILKYIPLSILIRPQYMQFPDDEEGFAMDNQVYLGDTGILIHPVVQKGAESVNVYIAETEVYPFYNFTNEIYYDYFDYTMYKGKGYYEVPVTMDKIPIFVRGGSIIPRKDRIRGSTGRMSRDPYTLFITYSEKVRSLF